MAVKMNPAEAAAWLRQERESRGWSAETLARRARDVARLQGSEIKLAQQLISKFEQGTSKRMPDWLRYVRTALAAEPAGSRPVASDVLPTRSAREGAVQLKQIDLGFSMGDGANLDDYVEEGVFEFDAHLLSGLTRTPAERLYVARGDGDSMMPTLINDDMVLIDPLQTKLDRQDRLWAVSLFGAGGIKRLQPISADRILVISDNPIRDNLEIAREDVRIMGRVIWVGRRV